MKRFLGVIGLLLLLANPSEGQTFQYRAALEPVAKDSFYRIILPPEVLGQLNTQLSDIRLYDEQRQEIPYLLKREHPVQNTKLFRAYEVVSKVSTPKVSTTLVLRNPAKSPINNLSLVIKNANVRKKARLSGSNDAKSWYVIEEAYTLEAMYNQAATAEVKLLDFPLSDYEYYQLEINDSLSAPINILRVGYYDIQAENGKYATIPGVSFTQLDSHAVRQSYIHLSLKNVAHIDKLVLDIKAPAHYRRTASVSLAKWRKGRRGERARIYESVSTIEISASAENTFQLSGLKAKDFYLIIDNEDSPPLTIGGLKAYQLHTYLIAELKQEKAYHLEFSNATVGLPAYDLPYFQDKIPANLPTIHVKAAAGVPVITRVSTSTGSSATPTIFTSPWFIWIAMGLVLAMLSYMSYRMLKEVGK
ncbi:MAG: hypothetical protein V4714_06485 [Bacteroidota bacterium]